MNSVSIIGRLGKDPEVRYTQSGTAVGKLNVAISGRKQIGGQWQDHVTWVSVKVFEKTAENAAQYLAKGDEVGIEGRLDLEQWTTKDTNEKRSQLVVLAQRVDFLRKKGEGGAAGGNKERPQRDDGSSDGGTTRERPTPDKPADAGQMIDDDLPF